jgi:nitronate monooxygenase
MTPASGGALASAVAEAGGLGMIGVGYVNRAWFLSEWAKITRPDVGVGLITWTIPEDPELLDIILIRVRWRCHFPIPVLMHNASRTRALL